MAAVWRRYLRFWGPRADADVDDELQFHVDMRVADYVARGMTEPDARAAARARFGDLGTLRAQCIAIDTRREQRAERARMLDAVAQDTRYALRTLGRQKGWTAVAMLTLALGIGANTAVFSVVDQLLIHPLPYPHADRIVFIQQEPAGGNRTGMQVTISPRAQQVRAWRQNAISFEDIEGYALNDKTLAPATGAPVVVHTAAIMPGFFAFAGQQPLIGRGFDENDLNAGGRVALLSEGLWRERYGSDAHVLGVTITLDDSVYTVVGVARASLRLPQTWSATTDILLPLDLGRVSTVPFTVGRLRPGMDIGAATREIDAITAHEDAASKERMRFSTFLVPPAKLVSFRESLVLLSAAVALVLLIACANVAHLLLARAATREREFAIRAAIGAGRGRLLRQLLTESVILALAGCMGGIALAWIGLHVILAARPAELRELANTNLDGRSLAVTVALSAVVGLVAGVGSALRTSTRTAQEVLKASASSSSQSRQQGRVRAMLVVTEMALSTTLLIGASLLVRSVAHLQSTDPGFDPAGLYSMDIPLPAARYAGKAASNAFFDELAARAARQPGVRSVAVVGVAPPQRAFMVGSLQAEGQPLPAAGQMSFVNMTPVRPDYFAMMRIRVLQGGTFTDTSTAANQVVVNEGIARRFWPGRPAVGRRLRVVYDGQGDWMTVVGVVANASTGGLLQDASEPMLYPALKPSKWLRWSILVRTSTVNPLPDLLALPRSIDPHLPPPTITSIESALRDSISGVRFTTSLLAMFTGLALLLAAVGLYGVMSYAVAQRTREIGIRIALGATRRNVARDVVARGALLALAGIVIGLAAAHWATRLLDNLLYGVDASDPLSFAAGTMVLFATALLACVVPTRRATAVDPLIAMRAE